MAYVLTNIVDGKVINLPEKKEFFMGRKDTDDIRLENDASISREHLKLRVKDDHVTIEDNISKYHTLLNGKKLHPLVEVTLNHNDIIQLGMYNNKFCFQKRSLILNVAASGLSSQKKATLKANLIKLKGTYMEKWTDSCTHLTLDRLTLTIKVLQALIDEKPIVTLDYWEAYVQSLEQKLPLPEINQYNKPPVAEQLLKSDFEYQFNPQRKSLFKNKMFVFQTSSCQKQMKEVIEKCGGSCISWEETPKTYEEISKSPLDYLLVKSELDKDNASYDAIIAQLLKDNKRHVPMSEIALAIVYCSCEVHCNPKFNKLAQVFDVSTPKPAAKEVLAAETQSQQGISCKTERVIPATVEDEWMTASSGSSENKNDDNQIAGPSGVKRPSKDTVESEANKKVRLEEGVTKAKTVKQSTLSVFIETQKPETIAIDDSSLESKSSQSQKRKATDQPMSKKINPFNSLTLTKKAKTITEEEENPFQLTRKPLKPTNTIKNNPFENLRTMTTKTQPIKLEKITPQEPKKEIRIVKMHSDISPISASKRSILNVTWMSKSSMKEEPIKIEEEDPQMSIVIEAFKDCVQIKPMQVYVKPNTGVIDVVDGRKNFKKFKKAKVLHPQVRIISRRELIKCVAGDITNELVHDNFNNDSDDEIPTGSKDKKCNGSRNRNVDSKQFIKPKPVIKRFVL